MRKSPRKIGRFLIRIPLLVQILILFIGSVLLPIGFQNIFFCHQVWKNAQTELLSRMNTALEENAKEYEKQFSSIIKLAREYNRQEWIYESLNRYYVKQIDFYRTYENKFCETIEGNYPYYPIIKNTIIYTDNETVFGGKYVRKTNQSFEELLLDQMEDGIVFDLKGDDTGENSVYFRIAKEKKRKALSEDRFVSIFFPLNYYSHYRNHQSSMRLDLNITSLEDMLMENELFENVILTDENGRVLFSKGEYSSEGRFDIYKEEDIPKNYVVLSQRIGKYPLKLYAEYDTEIFYNEVIKSWIQSLPITIVTMAISILCIVWVMGGVRVRIKKMVEQSKQIAEEKFSLNYYDEQGKDEISDLERSMNQMSERLKDLIENEYQAQMREAILEQESTKAKLLALQSQVNPHFMFNALESIRMKAIEKNERETARYILYMSRMFRNLITWENNIITLKDEIDFLNEFLQIQKYRFDDEFIYSLDIEEKALNCTLPKMVVQQLVENACIHGVEAISVNRFVSVVAKTEGDKLVIIVEDNGGGIPAEKLQALRELFASGENNSNSVGLYNIYNRLNLYYGDKFTFDIDSKLHEGTTCKVSIPLTYEYDFGGQTIVIHDNGG